MPSVSLPMSSRLVTPTAGFSHRPTTVSSTTTGPPRTGSVLDSVLEVTETDYKKCNSTHPSFFSNTGNTVFKLKRSGSFYFISGVSGHYRRGQRMIVKLMSHKDSDSDGGSSASIVAILSFGLLIAQFVLS
ncbi:early nodulin-like protein 5 [Actinidia rufa]|uniref:Early nodulin-like protein 5 n=1 Tax=Actinidia rufa TaxID=165716 RepID=A0A7J0DAX2_9ERIC|nr:early nodulin-like protein 5 [Actinidia rufa]